ncbi:MAG: hypothetical protein ABSG43_08515 [Solirubrobacteraceae bacterium]
MVKVDPLLGDAELAQRHTLGSEILPGGRAPGIANKFAGRDRGSLAASRGGCHYWRYPFW